MLVWVKTVSVICFIGYTCLSKQMNLHIMSGPVVNNTADVMLTVTGNWQGLVTVVKKKCSVKYRPKLLTCELQTVSRANMIRYDNHLELERSDLFPFPKQDIKTTKQIEAFDSRYKSK